MKIRSVFVCQQCGYESPQWYGKCPNCSEWNSLVEMRKEPEGKNVRGSVQSSEPMKAQRLSEVRHIEKNRLKSGLTEFDRVMGGGIVPGSVTLLAGDPGIGKSTLLLHVLSRIGGLYVSAEESSEQIQLRARRMGVNGENIRIASETVLERIVEGVVSSDATYPLMIVDSIQTIASQELTGMAGSVGQIRACAESLVGVAKRSGIPLLIIGHVTKEGEVAGPKILEHMVDTVLYLEGERYQDARILRTLKNRFGAVEEVGIFEMKEQGLMEIANPSQIFLKDRVKNVPGSSVTIIMEGSRPLLLEIQALVVSSQLAMPRRVGNGVDYNRLQLLTAVLQKRLHIPLSTYDVFVNVSGGLRISEPAADLAICLAILSSFQNKPLDPKTAAFGEIGLLGEIRGVGYEERRTKEAKRLGFTTVLTASGGKNLSSIAKMLT